ncbi:MAG: CHAD domain-containing protein [Ramlibacter sp.]
MAPDAPGTVATVDLARHAGTAVGEAIRRALHLKAGEAFPPLLQLYETDVSRLSLVVRRGASQVELALDQGRVIAGSQSVPLRELEVELRDGDPRDAIRLAQQWSRTHGLWLSSISKSMKGQRLAGTRMAPAPGPAAGAIGHRASGPALVKSVVSACLQQVIALSSEIAAGSVDAETIHQLRVGLRRLRTALRELAQLSDGIATQWETSLAQAFRALGQQRDRDFLLGTMQPQLEAAGGPKLDPSGLGADVPALDQIVRSSTFQHCLLDILVFVHRSDLAGPGPGVAARRIRKALERLHGRVLKDGARYTAIDQQRQHRVRKRVKRLRYLAEFVAPLFGHRRSREFVDRLKPVQEALGVDHDELVALQAYRALAGRNSEAWFAVGWLSARRDTHGPACQRAIDALARSRPFWT